MHEPPEGPHMYFKDGYYWLLLAEGGTALDHQVTVFRSTSPQGPWEGDPRNPILTAMNTTSLFQTVGHADLFEDGDGNWWGVALSTRSGPEYRNWPMNRETVLYPVSWPAGDFPTASPVRGRMSGPLPPRNVNIPITSSGGPFVKDPDHYTFAPNTTLPAHFTYWRFPHTENYIVSPPGHANTLQLTPSNANLTAFENFDPLSGQTFVGRRQTDTLFTFSVDMSFSPAKEEEEAGITAFQVQEAHAELGVVMVNGSRVLWFRANGVGAPSDIVRSIPAAWGQEGVRLQLQAINFTHYAFSAGPMGGIGGEEGMMQVALVDNALMSMSFSGTFAGIYATTNTASNSSVSGGTPAYFGNWTYQGMGQAIDDGEYYPSNTGPTVPEPGDGVAAGAGGAGWFGWGKRGGWGW